jgi:chaperonin cofactor prefoldin
LLQKPVGRLDGKKEEAEERMRAIENVMEYLHKELANLTEKIDGLMTNEIELVKGLGERYSDVLIEKEVLEL